MFYDYQDIIFGIISSRFESQFGYVSKMAVTKMVPNLVWTPDFFGLQGYRSPRNLGLEKFWPQECWSLH